MELECLGGRVWTWGVVLAAAASSTHAATTSTPTPATIALTGTDGSFGPNGGPGVRFVSLYSPPVNRAGQFAIPGVIGDQTNSQAGHWYGTGAARSVLAVGNGLVPGIPGGHYSAIDLAGSGINEMGEATVKAAIYGATDTRLNTTTWFAAKPNDVNAFARLVGPGGSGPFAFNVVNYVHVGGQRSVAFYAGGTQFQPTPAVWFGEVGNIRKVAEQNTLAPGTPFPTVFGANLVPISLSRSHQVLFSAPLVAASVNVGHGLFIADATTTSLLVRTNEPAPFLPAGTKFGQLSGLLGDDGSVALNCYPEPASGVGNLGATIFVGQRSNLRLVAARGMQAIGLPVGVQFGESAAVTAPTNGAVVFTSNLQGSGIDFTNYRSIWRDDGATAHLIVRQGQSAPGLPAGITLRDALSADRGNEIGQFLVESTLSGPGVLTGVNDRAFWLWDLSAGLVPIARTGDPMLLGDGSTATITSLGDFRVGALDPGSPIPGSTLFVTGSSPVGVVTFHASFANGRSGVFTQIVPAPSTCVLGAVVAGYAIPRRRRSTRPVARAIVNPC